MNRIVCRKYGPPDVLQIEKTKKPKPKDHEVLIKVYATTVTVADCRIRGFKVPTSFWLPARFTLGFFKPKQSVLGSELSGIIESVGKNVNRFKVGEKIFAFLEHRFGAYSEYVCVDENACITQKPENLSFSQSAPLSFGGITALYFLKKGKVTKSDKILIYGASGSVGTYAIQLAKYLGADVTGVCSAENMKLVKKLGADKVIDYTNPNWTDFNEKFDVFFDAVGKNNIPKSIQMINPRGRYIHTVTDPFTEAKIRFYLLKSNIKFIGGTYQATLEQIKDIAKLAEEGFIKPVLDQQYKFDEIVSAHDYVDKGHKKGNVVITIKHDKIND